MYFAPREITLRSGEPALLRSACGQDAAEDLRCMRALYGETEFLINAPEDVKPDEARHAEALDAVAGDPDALLLLCVARGEIVARLHGFVKPKRKVRHRFRLGVSVRRAWWGQGIATAMLGAAENAARQMGALQMELEVMAGNRRAVGLYEKIGYRIVMVHPGAIRLPDGRTEDEYLMMKKL